MDSSYTGTKVIHRDGRDFSAEVEVRFHPTRWSTGVGFSGEAQRYLNSLLGPDDSESSNDIWRSVVQAINAGAWRLANRPGVAAQTFHAEVVRVCLPEGATREETAGLLTEASRKATERYFAALDEGRVHLTASDVDKPFEYRPSTEFDEEFISRRRCFLEYVAEQRPGFLVGFGVSQATSIDQARRDRTLTPLGVNLFRSAVSGYLYGCRPEADALVARSSEILELAEETGEKAAGDYGGGWGQGQRYIAMAYVHWLRSGELLEDALDKAKKHFLTYYRRTKPFDRGSANLAAPELLFLGADSVMIALAKRLSTNPGRGATTPSGLFGDALRISLATDEAERIVLKAKLRMRMPLHLFRWLHRGHYGNVAFLLHAVFPRPEGPPSRLIERAWDFLPEIERRPEATFGWDIARK